MATNHRNPETESAPAIAIFNIEVPSFDAEAYHPSWFVVSYKGIITMAWKSNMTPCLHGVSFQLIFYQMSTSSSSPTTYGKYDVCFSKFTSDKYPVDEIELRSVRDGKIKKMIVKKYHAVHDTDFTFAVDQAFGFDRKVLSIEVIVQLDGPVNERNLLFDVEKKFHLEMDDPVFADTIIECDGVELKCHSFVLASRDQCCKTFLSNCHFHKLSRKIGPIQCDHIGRFLIVLGDKFCLKSSPNISSFWGNFSSGHSGPIYRLCRCHKQILEYSNYTYNADIKHSDWMQQVK